MSANITSNCQEVAALAEKNGCEFVDLKVARKMGEINRDRAGS
jgi:hypothetical protein